MALAQPIVFNDEQIQRYHDDGYLVIEGLLNRAEIDEMAQTFDVLHAKGSIPSCFTVDCPKEIARFYKPLYRRDGAEILHPDTLKDGGLCGGSEAKGPY